MGADRGPGQPVPLLRVLRRHRRGGRRRSRDGRLDHRRRPRPGPVAVRRAAVRPPAQRARVPRAALHRGLRALLPDRLPEPGAVTRRAGQRRSPLYDVLRARGAVFGTKFGWERANWFAARPAAGAGSAGRLAGLASTEPRGADVRAQQRLAVHRGGAPGSPRGRRADRHELVRRSSRSPARGALPLLQKLAGRRPGRRRPARSSTPSC